MWPDASIEFRIGVRNGVAELVLYIWLVEVVLESEGLKGFEIELLKERAVSEANFIPSLLKASRDPIFDFSNVGSHSSLVEALPFRDVHYPELVRAPRAGLHPTSTQRYLKL